ncbi:Lrp/AsnC family transcriptional regulator [Vibrio sp.]|nr:Lrp/AsnC family transcriptional regulator [Vibrio sp.]
MDRYNDRILQELQRNGKLSNVELAERIGLSPSATLRRVQELERTGVIKGYRAVIDKQKLEIGFVAYVSVGLSDHRKQSQTAFREYVQFIPEVVECHNITGEHEYLLRVETKDLLAYKRFHSDVLGECPQVRSITTLVVMESSKDER